MKKSYLLLALLLCSCMTYVTMAADSDIDSGLDDVTISVGASSSDEENVATVESNKEASENSESLTKKAKDELKAKEEEKKDEEEDDVTGSKVRNTVKGSCS